MSEFARELTELVQGLAKDAEPAAAGGLPPVWDRVTELGLVGIGIPEDRGGSGGSLGDLLVVIGELARAGVATPIVEAATAAYAAGMPEAGTFDTVAVRDVMVKDLGVVPYAPMARQVVVATDAGVRVVAPAGAEVVPVVDIAGQPAGRVVVTDAPAAQVDTDAKPVVERLALGRSASLLGGARGAYELTRSYVIERHQFGAPLIKIPSVAATLGQMAVRIDSVQTALDRAVVVLSDPDSSALRRFGAATVARVEAAQLATLVARSTHQLHGAVGITEEYPLHRYTRALWAQRDADRSQREWSTCLGATALAVEEDVLWDQLTA